MIVNEGVAELVGAIIGDGYIYRNNRKYQIGIVGSPKTDKEYLEIIKNLILKEWQKDVKIKLREGGLRIVFNRKEIPTACCGWVNQLNIKTIYYPIILHMEIIGMQENSLIEMN